MMPDSDISSNLTGWVPELELGDVARRLQKIYIFLDTIHNEESDRLATQIAINGHKMLNAIKEIVEQVQMQDAIDIGDPDINEEVVATLKQIVFSVEESRSMPEVAGSFNDARESIADLAEYVARY